MSSPAVKTTMLRSTSVARCNTAPKTFKLACVASTAPEDALLRGEEEPALMGEAPSLAPLPAPPFTPQATPQPSPLQPGWKAAWSQRILLWLVLGFWEADVARVTRPGAEELVADGDIGSDSERDVRGCLWLFFGGLLLPGPCGGGGGTTNSAAGSDRGDIEKDVALGRLGEVGLPSDDLGEEGIDGGRLAPFKPAPKAPKCCKLKSAMFVAMLMQEKDSNAGPSIRKSVSGTSDSIAIAARPVPLRRRETAATMAYTEAPPTTAAFTKAEMTSMIATTRLELAFWLRSNFFRSAV